MNDHLLNAADNALIEILSLTHEELLAMSDGDDKTHNIFDFIQEVEEMNEKKFAWWGGKDE